MDDTARNGRAHPTYQQYRTLLAVSEAILAHRDLAALFHDLTERLQQVVHFDYLILVLHDAADNTMRRHLLATSGTSPTQTWTALRVGEGPAGWVWQTQQPLIVSNVAEETRWPRFAENARQSMNADFREAKVTLDLNKSGRN
jgi:formate hydrogenlyase transcriptional activator